MATKTFGFQWFVKVVSVIPNKELISVWYCSILENDHYPGPKMISNLLASPSCPSFVAFRRNRRSNETINIRFRVNNIYHNMQSFFSHLRPRSERIRGNNFCFHHFTKIIIIHVQFISFIDFVSSYGCFASKKLWSIRKIWNSCFVNKQNLKNKFWWVSFTDSLKIILGSIENFMQGTAYDFVVGSVITSNIHSTSVCTYNYFSFSCCKTRADVFN